MISIVCYRLAKLSEVIGVTLVFTLKWAWENCLTVKNVTLEMKIVVCVSWSCGGIR